jgi:hypothetical protein
MLINRIGVSVAALAAALGFSAIGGDAQAGRVPARQALLAQTPDITLEAEDGEFAAGRVMMRSNASSLRTLWLHGGESVTMRLNARDAGRYALVVRYSNDQAHSCDAGPCQTVRVAVDGRPTAHAVRAQKSGTRGWGYDWDSFLESPRFEIDLSPGLHRITLAVERASGDEGTPSRLSVELDCATLARLRR